MPRPAPDQRVVELPGCKSWSARALLLAAQSAGISCLRGLSDSEDTHHLREALRCLGAELMDGTSGETRVRGWAALSPAASTPHPAWRGLELDVGEAATNLRLLAVLLARAAPPVEVVLRGAAGLFRRPHGELLDLLHGLGAEARLLPGTAPGLLLRNLVSGNGKKTPGIFVQVSSQPLSGLVLAAPPRRTWRIPLPEPMPSRGYLELSVRAAQLFRGSESAQLRPGELILHPARTRAQDFTVPGDASAATFFLVRLAREGLVAGAHSRSLRFHRPPDPAHPEARLTEALFTGGLLRRDEDGGIHATGFVPSAPLDFDLDPAPDAGPALAVLAAALPAGLRLRHLTRLRLKESDRVAGILELARALAAEVQGLPDDGLLIRRAPFRRAPDSPPSRTPFASRHDHRLAMAAAVAGLTVSDRDCVRKSFPGFWREIQHWCAA